ncbi:MAG: Gfo/Idh/MocA family oxidoreductase, partial [Planctomycetota bacterium]
TKGDFDVMYIGTLHPFHREQAEAALHAGKHVLVEKPVTTNYADAKALVDLAQATQRFFSEGIWTRYFPAVEEARRLLDERVIDEVMMVQADFGFDAGDTGDSEDSDFFNPSLGGGCTNYVTVYPISHITFALGPHPTIMSAIGSIHPDRKVDLNNSVSLAYPARKIAVAISSVTAETPEETHIIGKKGRITINTPAHCPTSYTLSIKNSGRGD